MAEYLTAEEQRAYRERERQQANDYIHARIEAAKHGIYPAEFYNTPTYVNGVLDPIASRQGAVEWLAPIQMTIPENARQSRNVSVAPPMQYNPNAPIERYNSRALTPEFWENQRHWMQAAPQMFGLPGKVPVSNLPPYDIQFQEKPLSERLWDGITSMFTSTPPQGAAAGVPGQAMAGMGFGLPGLGTLAGSATAPVSRDNYGGYGSAAVQRAASNTSGGGGGSTGK